MLPGRDRPDYCLGELAKPLFWLKANHRIQIDHVVVCARWQGMQIGPRVQHLPIGIAYVTDPSQAAADTLDFDKCRYVAIGLAHETSEQTAPTDPTPISGDKRTYRGHRGGPLLTLQRFRLRAPPQMQRLSTLMWQSLELGRPEGAASRFTATSGSMSLLPLPGFGS
jgi:hypothetical protein